MKTSAPPQWPALPGRRRQAARPFAAFFAALSAGAALASPAVAQGVALHHEGGVLGHDLRYQLEDTTLSGSFFVLVPSLGEGRTPAGPFVLDLDPLLIVSLTAGTYGPGGVGEIHFSLPNNPALAGATVFTQAVTFELTPGTVITDFSNRVENTLGASGEVQNAQGLRSEPIQWGPIVSTPDCRPTSTGGEQPGAPGSPPTYLSSVEAYDAQTEDFVLVGDLLEERSRHSATLLNDGRILVAGGVGPAGVLGTSEIFDPTTGTSVATGSLAAARVFHTATKLADGRVLVTGGSAQFNALHPLGTPASLQGPLLASSELFDPATGTWTPGPAFARGRTMHRASMLDTGKLLLTGGVERIAPGTSATTRDCRYYMSAPAPGVGTLLLAPQLPAPRAMHGQTSTLTGGALAVGGSNITFTSAIANGTNSVFVFDSQSEEWSIQSSAPGVYTCQVLVCTSPKSPLAPPPTYVTGGGWSTINLSTGVGTVQATLTEISGNLGSIMSAGSMTKDRVGVGIATADGGFRLLITGASNGSPDKTADIYVRNY